MTDYCADKAAGASHAGGQVFENFASHGITLAYLESTHFWRPRDRSPARGGADFHPTKAPPKAALA
jgi:hypothetical protein